MARLPEVTKCCEWSKDDAPFGICILELSRCCSFSVCRIVYLEQLHRLAGTINLTGVPRIPLPLTLSLARAKEDSAATLWVTCAIPAQSGGQRVAPMSSSQHCNILSNLKHLTMAITRQFSPFAPTRDIIPIYLLNSLTTFSRSVYFIVDR